MASAVYLCLITPGGTIQIKQGVVGVSENMSSALQAVMVVVQTENPVGNKVWLRHKGVEALSCEGTSDGETLIYERITSGPGKGAKVHTHMAVGPSASRSLEGGTEDIAASAAHCWDVFEGGSGGTYDAAVSDADAAILALDADYPF